MFERAVKSPPLVIAFRGQALDKVMKHNRVSKSDLNGALRKAGVWNIREVETVIIEPTGEFSIYKRADRPDDLEAEVLLDVPGYRRLAEHHGDDKRSPSSVKENDGKQAGRGGRARSQDADDIADEEA